MNLIYIHLPKCAGTAIKSYFKDTLGVELETIPHRNLEKNFANGYYKKDTGNIYFTTVRNPYQYWVSTFFYSRKLSKQGHWFWDGKYKRDDIDEHFKYYVSTIYERVRNNETETDSLTSYYNLYCYDKSGLFVPDYVAKVREMDALLPALKRIGIIPRQLPTEYFRYIHDKYGHNINHTNHKHYSSYYTPKLITMVYKIEEKIIDQYKYVFEIKQ